MDPEETKPSDPPTPSTTEISESLKLFVGQVPRLFTEQDLIPLFQQFGQVQQLSVLRDRITGTSKGMCTVPQHSLV